MYRNYIFDLYGTLVDIRSQERRPSLWKRMADLYACYGAVYEWKAMRRRFYAIVEEEAAALAAATGVSYPEMKLEIAFRRLYDEAEGRNALPPPGDMDAWIYGIANTFRVIARDWLRPYPATLDTLNTLKARGARLCLLSNAQAIFTRPELEVTGVGALMDEIRLSSDWGMMKPEPAFLQSLMDNLRLTPAETVMVGNDFAADMAIADACGIDGIYLNTWGDDAEAMAARMVACQLSHPERIRTILSGDIAEIL